MKFSVSKSALINALSVVTKGMGANSTLPVLSGIYLKAYNGTLELQATDLTIAVRHKCPAMVEEEGETVVSGKLLADIVKTLNDAAINFESEGQEIKLTCDKSTFNLKALDPSEFPEFPEVTPAQSVELPRDILSEMVNKVYRVASKDTTRRILSGVLLTVGQNSVRLVATDTFRLAVCDTHIETSSLDEEFEAILPASTLHDVLSLPSDSPTMLIGKTDSQVIFLFGNTTYITRKIEGNYPNYKMLIPDSCVTSIKVNTEEFSSAMRRMSVIAKANHSVRLHVDSENGTLKLTSESNDLGVSSESVPAEIEGEDISIGLKHSFVMECLGAQGNEDEITLELRKSTDPAIFKSYSNINYLYLLMPLMR